MRATLPSKALVTLLALAAVATGCRRDPPAKETLLIAGNAALTRYLEPLVKEFQVRNPKASVVCEPGGTTAAVIAVKRGAIDVAALSRQISADEDTPYVRDYQLCRDGIAVLLNKANPVADLTIKQIDDIFSGDILNWSKVGGPDKPIVVYAREKGSRSSRSFNELVLGGDDPFNGSKSIASSNDMLAAIKADPDSIGYVSLRHVNADVKVSKIEGVEMTRLTMLSGRYPLSRTFYLAVFMNSSKLADDFVQFTLSKDGQEILAKDGLLPVH